MGTSASFARKALSCLAAALLAFTLVPASALAGGNGDAVSPSIGETQEAGSAQADDAAGAASAGEPEDGEADVAASAPLASVLAGAPTAFVNADVALDAEPVIGSFTVDGLTFAVTEGSNVELVGVSEAAGASPRRVVTSSQGPGAPDVLPDLGSTPAASEAEAEIEIEAETATLLLPESVAYGDVEYSVISIGAYAFYLSGVTSVELPATVTDVDERAFRSSDVASVTVAENNPTYSSFDGALYSADKLSLLLIPEGKQGAVLLPKGTEVAEAGKFSHCSLVDAISAEDGAAFASENGLLYTSDLTTLLRVPAGATEITIREGCTTIAAGAMEGCAQLATINAPASVTSISPDVFASVPTISLPAATLAEDAPQLTALVALSSVDDGLPAINPSAIKVNLPSGADGAPWQGRFVVFFDDSSQVASGEKATVYSALPYTGDIWAGVPAKASYVTRSMDSSQILDQGVITNGTDNAWYIIASQQASRIELYGSSGNRVLAFWDFDQRKVTEYSAFESIAVGRYIIKNLYTSSSLIEEIASRHEQNMNAFLDWKWTYYTINFSANGGTGTKVPWTNCTDPNSYTLPSTSNSPITRAGYTLSGWKAGSTVYAPGASVRMRDLATAAGCLANQTTDSLTLEAQWRANTITLSWDAQGGSAVGTTSRIYAADAKVPMPNAVPAKTGFVFTGWFTAASGGTQVTATTALPTANTIYYAQWQPAISADVPLEVTAQVDLLGIEEQQEAQGYIESRCGEPLTVTSIELTPLAGATELFGAGNVADVALEVLPDGSAAPSARFALDASASQAPAVPAAFRMASYGDRVPISYRFDIPDALLSSLVEATKPVCSVAYTVALAS